MEVVGIRDFGRIISRFSISSLQFCLGNKPWQPCYVMRMNRTTIMLDCSLDLPVLLNFLPLPLVYRSTTSYSTYKALESEPFTCAVCLQ